MPVIGVLNLQRCNLGNEPFVIRKGDRIAQMVVKMYESVEVVEGGVNETKRGDGGFGSTGV